MNAGAVCIYGNVTCECTAGTEWYCFSTDAGTPADAALDSIAPADTASD